MSKEQECPLGELKEHLIVQAPQQQLSSLEGLPEEGNQSVQISVLSNYDNLDFQLPVTQPAKQLRYEQETSKSQSPRPKIPVESVSLGISAFITMKKKTIFQSINVGGQKHSTL